MKTRLFGLSALVCLLVFALTVAPSSFTAGQATYDNFTFIPLALNDYQTCKHAPTLVSPANGSTIAGLIPTVTINNGDAANTTSTFIYLYSDPELTQRRISVGTGTITGEWSYTFHTNLEPNTTYYWNALCRCGNDYGPTSATWSFTTGPEPTLLPAPTLVSPANAANLTTTDVTLKWNAVPGAEGYEVLWHITDGGWHARYISNTEYSFSMAAPDMEVSWTITAYTDLAMGSESDSWTFIIDPGATAVAE